MKRKRSLVMTKILSILLSFMICFSSLPLSAFANSVDNVDRAKEIQNDEINQESKDDDVYDVNVSWQASLDEIKNTEEGSIKLAASLNEESSLTTASVEIKLTATEAVFLGILSADGKTLNEEVYEDGIIKINEESEQKIVPIINEDGSVTLYFDVDNENRSIEYTFNIVTMEDATLPYTIDVSEEDIIVKSVTDEGEEISDVNVKKDVSKITIIKDETENIEENTQQKKAKTVESRANENVITINSYMTNFSREIFWVDNNDETSIRPSESGYTRPKLEFSLNGGAYQVLTQDNLSSIGLNNYPSFSVDTTGVGVYTIYAGNNVLPSNITSEDIYGNKTSYDIEWRITPADIDGYEMIEVTDENIETDYPSVDNTGWYYILLRDIRFTCTVHMGVYDEWDSVSEAVLNNFHLIVNVDNGRIVEEHVLSEFRDTYFLEHPDSDSMVIAIDNTWKYNIDGGLITYYFEEMGEGNEAADGKVFVDGTFDPGDYLSVLYDNTAAENHGASVDKLYNNGSVVLTLTGTKTYEATKVWLDDGSAETKAARPEGIFQLWRYREGNSFSTASVVRDKNGSFVETDLDTSVNVQQLEVEIDNSKELTKYDPEGYEYFYVLREYLDENNAGDYEQVFGSISENGDVITDRVDINGDIQNTTNPDDRATNNDFIYNNGVITNRIKGNVSTQVTKIWKASSFQSGFDEVNVEFTLQSRIKGQENWTNTNEKLVMDDFYAEHLTDTKTKQMPKYDYKGRELEYRWVESGVYVDGGENIYNANADGTGSFSLTLDGRNVEFVSTPAVDENNNTTVTNTIANTIKYDVIKEWHNTEGEKIDAPEGVTISFNIYQMLNNEYTTKDPIATFEMDGVVDDEKKLVNEELGVYAQEISPWMVRVYPLMEFNSEGMQYEYLLMENGNDYMPSMDTIRTEEGYESTLVNVPGPGNRILVAKGWIDDSDIAHREGVTIGIYKKDGDEKIKEVTLENGVWYKYVGIGDLDVDDVYILETKVGDTDIPLQSYTIGVGQPNYVDPVAPNEYDGLTDQSYTSIQYETQYHKYDVKYTSEIINGEKVYKAVNRRLGNINLTVEKAWVDGDGELREQIQEELRNIKNEKGVSLSLVAKLDFDMENIPDYYSISRTGVDVADSVVIGNSDNRVPIKDKEGNNVSSVQNLLNADKVSDVCYFYNLPKYDRSGIVTHYKISEVWVDDNGVDISSTQLKNNYPELYELYSRYSSTITYGEYNVGTHFSEDSQKIDIKNALKGSKTLSWEKVWKDKFAYENGNRMDLYIDVYQVSHEKAADGTIQEKTSLYISNYRWVYSEAEGSDQVNRWKVQFSNAPKYDSLGYEITYYAVERTDVDFSKFDYQPGRYYVYTSDASNEATYIGDRNSVDNQYSQYTIDLKDVSGKPDVANYANYALIENGIFENVIKANISIRGQKIWQAVPASYPREDLPSVTFELYRSLANQQGEEENVASITVKDWTSVYENGSYIFNLIYLGENIIEQGNNTVYGGDGEGTKIPKYNEDGELYSYELKEASINWPNDANVDQKDVFDDPIENTYLVQNVYNSEKGKLAIKKFMELSFNDDGTPKAFPGVSFTLYRSYLKNDNTMSEEEEVEYKIWNSSEVKEAYEKASMFGNTDAGTSADPLENIIVFEDLDIYAPNGSKYVYSVSERKDYLGGIDTWVVDFNLEKENIENNKTFDNIGNKVTGLYPIPVNNDSILDSILEFLAGDPDPSATFINAPQKQRATVEIEGAKVWNDYTNIFGLRPDDITLTLYRYANEQPGQGNSINEVKVDESLYEIKWNNKGDTDGSWSYEITGTTEGELEKHAPNGMLWKYVVKETLPDSTNYIVSPADGAHWKGKVYENRRENDNNDIIMNNLSNNITMNIPYSKTWVDNGGYIIQNDYLGYDLTVDFELQVSEVGSTTYYPAQEYFSSNLSDDSYNAIFQSDNFETSITGRINSDVWGKTNYYRNLPRLIIKKDAVNGEVTKLQYRIVESGIEYGSVETVVNVIDGNNTYTYDFVNGGMFSPAYWADGRGLQDGQDYADIETIYNKNDTRNMYNRMQTTSFSFTKTWDKDNNNIYSTRPTTSVSGYNWQISFIVQKKAQTGGWENVEVYANNGTSRDMIVTIYGKNSDKSISGSVSGLPTANDDGEELTYRVVELDSDYVVTDGHVAEEYILYNEDDMFNYSYSPKYGSDNQVTNTLQTTSVSALKKWNPSSQEVNVTLELKYMDSKGAWKSFATPAKVTLDGSIDQNPTKPYYESGEWKAVWNDLPLVVKGSKLDENGHTQYKVFETVPSGYLQESTDENVVDGLDVFSFTNVESTSYSVEKVWYGVESSQQNVVKVGLYRTTGEIGDENSEAVLEEGKDTQRTLLLTKTNLKGTFTSLPKYDENGKEYIYYARELEIDGIKVENYNYRILNSDNEGKTTITNIGRKDIVGKKIWMDNSNAYNTRPEDIQLILYRSVEGGEKEQITATPVWNKHDKVEVMQTYGESEVAQNISNEWEYKFKDLLATNDEGKEYIYEVEEVVPEEYAVTYDGYNITNTLDDVINIPVKKVWDDKSDYDKARPRKVTVELYANDTLVDQATFKGKGDTWEYVFTDLPEYNELNQRIVYTLKEVNVAEGYKVSYDGYTITNHKDVVIRKTDVDTSDNNNLNLFAIIFMGSAFMISVSGSVLLRRRYRK